MPALNWLFVMIGIFFILIIYIFFYAPFIDQVFPLLNETVSSGINERMQQVIFQLNIVPWVGIGGLLLFGFLSSQKKEPDTGLLT